MLVAGNDEEPNIFPSIVSMENDILNPWITSQHYSGWKRGCNKTVGDAIVGSPSPHHTPHLTTHDMMGGPSIDVTLGTASPQPTTRSTAYIEMVGDSSFGGSTSPHPILYPTTCTRMGGRFVLNVS